LFGYDTGQISSMLLFPDFKRRFGQYQDAEGEWQFDVEISSLVVSMMSIGTLFGALAGAYTADWFGRRRSLSIGVAIFVVGNIIQITAMNSWVHLMMGRIVAGLGVGILSIGVPMVNSSLCTSITEPPLTFSSSKVNAAPVRSVVLLSPRTNL